MTITPSIRRGLDMAREFCAIDAEIKARCPILAHIKTVHDTDEAWSLMPEYAQKHLLKGGSVWWRRGAR